ncbi:MAG: hypothetical protein AVDCRST_MAG41-1013, partial [uncultured Corynebacteriales bacterium]
AGRPDLRDLPDPEPGRGAGVRAVQHAAGRRPGAGPGGGSGRGA